VAGPFRARCRSVWWMTPGKAGSVWGVVEGGLCGGGIGRNFISQSGAAIGVAHPGRRSEWWRRHPLLLDLFL
jgi:hypothetical protein